MVDMYEELIKTALQKGFITEDDETWAYNTLLNEPRIEALVPRPSEVIRKFKDLYMQSPEAATNWYYQFSQDTNYIQIEAVKKNKKWISKTEYGDMQITVNLSKPEKDPRDIAKAVSLETGGDYPKCLLCREAEGFRGRPGYPDRTSHRLIPINLSGDSFFFQYSPYVYYNEHCIVLDREHAPMKISRRTPERLFSFLEQFPHYFIGSNADLPIVGGSLLSHEHFQGGRHEFPIDNAQIIREIKFKDYPDVAGGILKWPVSVLRLKSKEYTHLIDIMEELLKGWRNYSNETLGIISHSDGVLHNTITPIARKRGMYELDLAFRCNITSDEHPLGVFHPHADCHHIKKENIGLIEVMGLAILPARLVNEYDIDSDRDRNYIAGVFEKVLEHCGVFKQNDISEFESFIYSAVM